MIIKKFLLYVLLFLTPLILILTFGYIGYSKSGGDLNRIGKISFPGNYRNIFFVELDKIYYDTVEDSLKSSYDYIVVGDSFSWQGLQGYQNYLASVEGIELLSLHNSYYGNMNQIEYVYGLLNTGFFNLYQPKYLILESVERSFISRTRDIDKHILLDNEDIYRLYNSTIDPTSPLTTIQDSFKYPIFSLFYLLDDNAFFSDVYKFKTKIELFSLPYKELCIYNDDITSLDNASADTIGILNKELNELSGLLEELNIKLIVLPAPDKYDLYYDYIIDNKFPNNPFFDLLDKEEKGYLFINSKEILLDKINQGAKDIYFADDTHWSPIAAKLIADEIVKISGMK